MHNYEQKVLLIYDGASPRLCHLNVSLFPRLGRLSEPPAHWGYATISPARLRECLAEARGRDKNFSD